MSKTYTFALEFLVYAFIYVIVFTYIYRAFS
jgi:hypothetical protein